MNGNIILIIISVVLYYPFFKMYDKELLEEEYTRNGLTKKALELSQELDKYIVEEQKRRK